MNELEKKYYEDAAFWYDGMLEDPRNMERFKLTTDLIPGDVTSLLDAGCGNGVFVNHVSRNRPEIHVHAWDRSNEALKHVHVEKTLGDVTNLPFDDNAFDCVSCLEVIEHLPIPAYKVALNELKRVAAKYVLISVPYNEELEDSYTRCPSCKTIFNWELHLRRFNDENFRNLLNEYGFKNIKIAKAGGHAYLKYHKQFRKIFYPEQFLRWNSPICPLCGYEERKNMGQIIMSNGHERGAPTPRRKLISYLSVLPKLFWPKETKYYWIIGLFEKEWKHK
jgi:ubiquinone/menaquinone biosynthesis C-methylase UbiE